MLWAVRVRAEHQELDTTFPVGSAEEGAESADRLNDWVAEMAVKHPQIPIDLEAEVIEWPLSADEHEHQLIHQRAAEEEWRERPKPIG